MNDLVNDISITCAGTNSVADRKLFAYILAFACYLFVSFTVKYLQNLNQLVSSLSLAALSLIMVRRTHTEKDLQHLLQTPRIGYCWLLFLDYKRSKHRSIFYLCDVSSDVTELCLKMHQTSCCNSHQI